MIYAEDKPLHGDCDVPKRYGEDKPALGSWVNEQRQQKKKLDRGEPSKGMTAARVAKLEALGFVWEGSKAHPNEAQWEAQLARLTAYRATHGDCNVPKIYAEDEPLGSWVAKQRTLKRKLDRGEPCKRMTPERVAKLEAPGFLLHVLNLDLPRGTVL